MTFSFLFLTYWMKIHCSQWLWLPEVLNLHGRRRSLSFTGVTIRCCLMLSLGFIGFDWIRFHFFTFKMSWCFFTVIIYLHCEAPSCHFYTILLNVNRDNLFILQLLPKITSSLKNYNVSVPLAVIHAHNHDTASAMFSTWCCMLWIMSCFFPFSLFRYFLAKFIWLSCSRMLPLLLNLL